MSLPSEFGGLSKSYAATTRFGTPALVSFTRTQPQIFFIVTSGRCRLKKSELRPYLAWGFGNITTCRSSLPDQISAVRPNSGQHETARMDATRIHRLPATV